MIKIASFYSKTNIIYFVAAIISLFLSTWISYRESVINPDAICYLLSAEEISRGGLNAAMNLCPQAIWPFFSYLVYLFAQLTSASYLLSANFLDAIFTLISVITFIAIVHELGGTRRVLCFAAMVILLSHEFNAIRQYIVRDHGFWAFYLLSLYFLLNYFRESTWLSAIAWGTSLLIATLFRIEGAIFLLLLPFVSWVQYRKSFLEKTKQFFMLNSIVLLFSMLLLSWFVIHPQQSIQKLGRVGEISQQLQDGITIIISKFQHMKTELVEHVIPREGARDASTILVLVFLSAYLINVVSNLSLIYFILLLYAWFSHAAIWTRSSTRIIFAYLLVNIFVTSIFFIEHFFLSKRYLIALSLILMLWVPFALDKLLTRTTAHIYYRRAYYLIIFLIFVSSLDGIFEFGYSKLYIRQAGDWLEKNVSHQSSLYVNNFQLMYYSQHFGSDIFKKIPIYRNINIIADQKWKQYDYVALRIDKKNEPNIANIMQSITIKPVQQFQNKRGDQVVIFKVPHEERRS